MASSSNVFKYPPRLYAEGKSPLQHRSMNHNCYLSKIGQIREGLGIDVWDGLEKSSLGVFIKLAELEYTWAAKKVHLFLTNQLKVDNFHEIWSMIDGRPVRFSLNEFAAITGMNCDPFDPSEKFEADHRELWEAMKVPISEGPKFNELRTVMDLSKAWDLKERMMVGRLCLLSVAIHGVHHGSRFPLSSAIRVLDPVSFEKYPWGRVAFECLLKSVKTVDFNKDGYVIKGCVHALLMWVYESFPGLGEGYGLRRPILTGIPFLDWQSTRKDIDLTEFIKNEKKLHGQVIFISLVVLFYRAEWPYETYGWLKDYHMGAAMAMFRKRLMRKPSAYPNQRITFLDQDMMRELARDYEHFSGGRRSFKFRDYFEEHLNGTAPTESATYKKWFIDVDHLYACLFINGDHWVALDIDLRVRRINIYDSIPHLTTDPEMAKQCMFLRLMIPAMMSAFVPINIRKKSNAMLDVKKITKKVPLNKDPGDCAIYTLKYIECLALGKSFDGLCDENINAIRVKLAAELFDEVREAAKPSNLDLCGVGFKIPSLMDESIE
ncbi:uncharacterized protein LOC9327292 [Arabidopsis lyrata subsp. lyrata]|nr:uncharacterized protein LOC9327292 [Arabidopsis lyrata subsp. lyrata]|eukprot:XP_002893924.2 uncharacterized protein LOC9327292 [Arabidopsis lyrata subsp. lyrata]